MLFSTRSSAPSRVLIPSLFCRDLSIQHSWRREETYIVKDVVEEVASTETERRSSGVQINPVVEGIGDSDCDIFVTIVVGMTDKRSLPVVVEVAVRNSHLVGTMSDIEKAIIKVFVMVAVAGKINMINPDLRSFLNANGITSLSKDLGDDKVTDDNVLFLINAEANTLESFTQCD
jgi:hypothetical protein